MNWANELESFVADSRAALRCLVSVFEVSTRELLGKSRQRRRGTQRLSDGRRVLWRFHGTGVYVRLAGQRPVDFDLTFRDDRLKLKSDLWRIAVARRLPRPSNADVQSLVLAGFIAHEHQAVVYVEAPDEGQDVV
jgi:hypothetical protein